MKVCLTNRNGFYEVVAQAFKQLCIRPRLAELGVLRGRNARQLYNSFDPEHNLEERIPVAGTQEDSLTAVRARTGASR